MVASATANFGQNSRPQACTSSCHPMSGRSSTCNRSSWSGKAYRSTCARIRKQTSDWRLRRHGEARSSHASTRCRTAEAKSSKRLQFSILATQLRVRSRLSSWRKPRSPKPRLECWHLHRPPASQAALSLAAPQKTPPSHRTARLHHQHNRATCRHPPSKAPEPASSRQHMEAGCLLGLRTRPSQATTTYLKSSRQQDVARGNSSCGRWRR